MNMRTVAILVVFAGGLIACGDDPASHSGLDATVQDTGVEDSDVGEDAGVAEDSSTADDSGVDAGPPAAPTPRIDLAWMGIANWLIRYGETTILTDAYFHYPADATDTEGAAIRSDILSAAGVTDVDYILVSHSHFDHILDVGSTAMATGAQVLASATTCFVTQAQGLPEDRCTVVTQGDTMTLGEAELRVARTIHWWPFVPTIGGYQVLTEPPSADQVATAPNGGVLSFLFRFQGASPRAFFLQGSLAPLGEMDGSDEDYAANLTATFAGVEEPVLWIATGNFLTNGTELQEYLSYISPQWVIPNHWENNLRPDLRAPVTESFNRPAWYFDALDAASVELVMSDQFYDEFIFDDDGLRKVTEAPLRTAMGF